MTAKQKALDWGLINFPMQENRTKQKHLISREITQISAAINDCNYARVLILTIPLFNMSIWTV